MSDDLHNVNELMEELEGLSITTSQGSFIKKEDVRRLVEKRFAAKSIEAKEQPKPKNIGEARAQAKEFLKSVSVGEGKAPDLGRAVSASEPQPSSRT